MRSGVAFRTTILFSDNIINIVDSTTVHLCNHTINQCTTINESITTQLVFNLNMFICNELNGRTVERVTRILLLHFNDIFFQVKLYSQPFICGGKKVGNIFFLMCDSHGHGAMFIYSMLLLRLDIASIEFY